LEYNKKFYTLVLTLKSSFIRVIRFIISCAPLFLGYLFCGMVTFSPYSDNFLDVGSAAATMFALINGDEIHDTFKELTQNYTYPLVARIYLYTFIMLFITAVWNIFIFIIEDAYHLAKAVARRMDYSEDETTDDYALDYEITKHLEKTLDLKKIMVVIEKEDQYINFNSDENKINVSSIMKDPVYLDHDTRMKLTKIINTEKRKFIRELEEMMAQKQSNFFEEIENKLSEDVVVSDDEN